MSDWTSFRGPAVTSLLKPEEQRRGRGQVCHFAGFCMHGLYSPEALAALFQVILIDLVLAGDNAIVIGLAASGLPQAQRTRAIVVGIAAATVLRIFFASIAAWLLAFVGLLLAGGILLLWVCWKMWRELRTTAAESRAAGEALAGADLGANGTIADGVPRKTFAQAALQIVVADISMSLDNVLAVAGAAHEHPVVLIFGLGLSVALMGVAASFVARLLQRYHWIAYVGLAIILYVALSMIWEGAFNIQEMVTTRFLLPFGWGMLPRIDLLAELCTSEMAAGELTELGASERRA
jgi:YjbE family integral membrane protein